MDERDQAVLVDRGWMTAMRAAGAVRQQLEINFYSSSNGEPTSSIGLSQDD